jgi:hypothetical protein
MPDYIRRMDGRTSRTITCFEIDTRVTRACPAGWRRAVTACRSRNWSKPASWVGATGRCTRHSMNGLSAAEATERLSRIGPNALPERAPDPLWRRFVRQFQSPLIHILLFGPRVRSRPLVLRRRARLANRSDRDRPDPAVQRNARSLSRTAFRSRLDSLEGPGWSPGMGTPRWSTRPSPNAWSGSRRLGASRSRRPRPSRRDTHGRARRHAG